MSGEASNEAVSIPLGGEDSGMTEAPARDYGRYFPFNGSGVMNDSDATALSDSMGHLNDTDLPQNTKEGIKYDWILCECASVLFTVVSFYILCSILYHRFKEWKKTRLLNSTVSNRLNEHPRVPRPRISTSSTRSLGGLNARSGRRVRILNFLNLAAAILVFLRLLSEQLVFFLSEKNSYACNVIADTLVILYACPIAAIYLFLWFRQRFLYREPTLKSLSPQVVRVVSGIILAVMSLGETATALVFILTITYKPGRLGCPTDRSYLADGSQWIMIIVFTATFQILLLGLFIMPLIRHRSTTQSLHVNAHSTFRLDNVIKRICIITSVCMASDLAAGLVTIAIPIPIVSNLVYDLNLIVNLVGITCTFKNRKMRLFSFCYSDKNRETTVDIPSISHTVENGRRNVVFASSCLRSAECQRHIQTIR